MTKILRKPRIEGECDSKGQWLPKKQLLGQSYIQHPEPGFYRVIHNLNKMYNVGTSLLGKQGTVEIFNITLISFDVNIKLNGTPVDIPFHMTLSEAEIG